MAGGGQEKLTLHWQGEDKTKSLCIGRENLKLKKNPNPKGLGFL